MIIVALDIPDGKQDVLLSILREHLVSDYGGSDTEVVRLIMLDRQKPMKRLEVFSGVENPEERWTNLIGDKLPAELVAEVRECLFLK